MSDAEIIQLKDKLSKACKCLEHYTKHDSYWFRDPVTKNRKNRKSVRKTAMLARECLRELYNKESVK